MVQSVREGLKKMIIITFGEWGVSEGHLSLFFWSKNDFHAILDHKNFSCIVHFFQKMV